MAEQNPHNPLEGKTLETILLYFYEKYGWEGLFNQIPAKCFRDNPSIKSSLTFLRKTPWARTKLETWYIYAMTRNK